MCNIRMFQAPSSNATRANTCELKVQREVSIHVYASRTLIQDCAMRSHEKRRSGKVERAVLLRRGFPKKLGRSGVS